MRAAIVSPRTLVAAAVAVPAAMLAFATYLASQAPNTGSWDDWSLLSQVLYSIAVFGSPLIAGVTVAFAVALKLRRRRRPSAVWSYAAAIVLGVLAGAAIAFVTIGVMFIHAAMTGAYQ